MLGQTEDKFLAFIDWLQIKHGLLASSSPGGQIIRISRVDNLFAGKVPELEEQVPASEREKWMMSTSRCGASGMNAGIHP
jgi:hypothetical protein